VLSNAEEFFDFLVNEIVSDMRIAKDCLEELQLHSCANKLIDDEITRFIKHISLDISNEVTIFSKFIHRLTTHILR
jgi:hypothetical protein